MIEYSRFTRTQQMILEVLEDGLPHARKELAECLSDDLAGSNSMLQHLSAMRKLLRPSGHDIICQFVNNRRCYRHVILLPSAYDGRT